jgi:diacylglycerol kinase (ATP)
MQKHKVILNPVAGQGAGARRRSELERLLAECDIPYDLQLTERPMHAAEIAGQAVRDGFEVVVAVGGDGTGNEVLNGLMRSAKEVPRLPALGLLSVGRGNDFAFGAGVPATLAEGCRCLARGYRRPMDVGLVVGGDYPEGRYFGNGIGVGFDTIVGLEAAKMRRIHGFLAYVLGALKTMFLYYRAPLVRIERDGQVVEQKALQTSVMNGRRMGGTFYMAPEARNDDGLLDLCIAGEPRRAEMIGIILRYMKGTQAESPYITVGRTQAITLTALEGDLVVHSDGETVCTRGRSLRVECIPRAVEVLCEPPAPPAGQQ